MHANTNSHPNKAQRTPTLAVAPVTRAIRTALAISATLLALGGSGAAFAQTCIATSSTVETCEGIFTGTVPGTFFTPVTDLTLVLGDSANSVPTSVTPTAGLMGIDASWGGNVGVTSYADITTVGATGIFAYGSSSASVSNNGSITTDVTATGAKAMDISAYGDVTVVNSGAVKAYSTGVDDVTAVNASSLFGHAEVYNKFGGTITANAQDGNAIAIDVSAYSSDQVLNRGAIVASSVNGIAIGTLEQSSTGQAQFQNLGSITAPSTNGQAVGALISGASAYALNLAYTAYFGPLSGNITVTSGADAAIGLEAYGSHYALARSTGSITVTSDGGTATGIIADAYKGAARIINTGSISATALDYSPAVGVEAYSAFSGAARVNNFGTIAATALSGSATGIMAQAHYGQASVVNSGDVSAIAGVGTYYQHNRAIGIVASSGAGYSPGITHVTNSGNISASGPTLGEGIVGSARYGDLTITNTATGTIAAYGQDEAIGIGTGQNNHNSFGRYIDDYTSQADIDNAGSITATANGTHCGSCRVNATGIQVFLNSGNDVTITNSGDIAASVLGTAANNLDDALGIDAVTYRGNITANNSGSVSVINNNSAGTTGYADYTVGMLTNTEFGTTAIVNSGDIDVSTSGKASITRGIWASTQSNNPQYDNGAVSVVNSGNINVTANSSDPFHFSYMVEGIRVFSDATSGHGAVNISNSGDIKVSANAADLVYGVDVASYGYGDFTVSNSGNLTTSNDTFSRTVYGHTYVIGGASMGILAKFGAGAIAPTITNSGDISTTGASLAFGIYARATINVRTPDTADLTVVNSGSISALADNFTNSAAGEADASGIRTRNFGGSTTLINSGTISATVSEDPSASTFAMAQGIQVNDNSSSMIAGEDPISITNTGSVSASFTSNGAAYNEGHYGDADGIIVFHGYDTVNVVNSGAIAASAQDDAAQVAGRPPVTASGITIGGHSFSLNSTSEGSETLTNSNTGSITAAATSNYADVSASATGIYAVMDSPSLAKNGITVSNAGLVSATATVGGADTLGAATAVGLSTLSLSDGFVYVRNTGTVLANATTPGVATATGISATGYSMAVALNAGGIVNAIATGTSGTATGLSLTDTGTAALTTNNDGVLMATFNGAGGSASGAMITSAADVAFSNSGHIAASADNAVGVNLVGTTATTLTNSGTISAVSSSGNGVAVLTGASSDTITNTGTINGAIQTGAGNDTFTNAVGGIWNAVGASDFGAGDDIITNAGTIHLSNTTISLGSDPIGNQFGNAGLITVVGINAITMITGTSANPNAFTNNGTLNFQNGLANNTLTINGNFAGNGQIDMDVNGAQGTGDQLKITGNVAAGSVNTVNVNLLSDPTTASSLIPLVQVGGTAAAGSFVLGTFTQPKGFLGLSEALVSTPNLTSLGLTVAAPPVAPPPVTPPPVTPPPVTPPPVTISVAVSGLSELGTLAASAAPGVQSLMRSQIGTLEDRMGAASQTVKGGLSLWTRAFADSGTVDPGHSAGNFGQNGNFGFDQSNSGAEVGLDFAISDEFKAGALFAKSQANQSLDGNKGDSSKITGDSSGIYGTWISTSGFYVDASYRWMTFHDRLHAPTGYASIHGNADAFNLEAGKTWTLQNGLQIAPQFQYTLTKVDNIHAQTGSLAGFQSTGDNASRARLGVMFSKNYTPASGHAVWMPYASLSVVQELDGKNSYSVNNTFFGETNTKGASVLAETGVNVQFGKLAVFGGLNWQDGGAMKSFFGGQVGLRYTF